MKNLEDFQEPLEKICKSIKIQNVYQMWEKRKYRLDKNIKTLYKLLKLEALCATIMEWSKRGKIDILIDPALAFGSGHHETTSSCLLAIDDL